MKKTAFQKSEFGKINLVDVLNSVYYSLVASLISLSDYFISGEIPSKKTFIVIGGVFVGGIIKKLFTKA